MQLEYLKSECNKVIFVWPNYLCSSPSLPINMNNSADFNSMSKRRSTEQEKRTALWKPPHIFHCLSSVTLSFTWHLSLRLPDRRKVAAIFISVHTKCVYLCSRYLSGVCVIVSACIHLNAKLLVNTSFKHWINPMGCINEPSAASTWCTQRKRQMHKEHLPVNSWCVCGCVPVYDSARSP